MTDAKQEAVEVIVNQALIDEISRLEDELAEVRKKRDDIIERALRAEAKLATTTADRDQLRAELAAVKADWNNHAVNGLGEIERMRAELAAVKAERDKWRQAAPFEPEW